jgi:pimeloyl-ACP methyl ester carboxylesterase
MPWCLTDPDTEIYYETAGDGYPILLLAPGGLRSSIEWWELSISHCSFNPIEDLADQYRIVAIDQRHAGKSTSSPRSDDDWLTYCKDHVSILDQLDIVSCHVMGACIGASFVLRLCEAVPKRIASATLINPIGLHQNRHVFLDEVFGDWVADMRLRGMEMSKEVQSSIKEQMFGGDFVFSVSREWTRACQTPMLVLAGDDRFHPPEIAREIAQLAPRARLASGGWRESRDVALTEVRAFLAVNTPLKSEASQ